MARPTGQRTARTYVRDIEHLNRLRSDVLINQRLDDTARKDVINQIDSLVSSLLVMINLLAKTDTE